MGSRTNKRRRKKEGTERGTYLLSPVFLSYRSVFQITLMFHNLVAKFSGARARDGKSANGMTNDDEHPACGKVQNYPRAVSKREGGVV